jgi:CRP-like cAMP-binding protein
MGCTLEERVALILLELSENFGISDGSGMRLIVTATHKDLAEMVGASRPRVTEFLTIFEQKHLIARRGRQLIIKRGRMERFLEDRHASADQLEVNESLSD